MALLCSSPLLCLTVTSLGLIIVWLVVSAAIRSEDMLMKCHSLTVFSVILVRLLCPGFCLGQPQQGARYLIVASSEFVDAVQPLAEWKTRKGMLAKVVSTTETGTTVSEVQAYIRDAWDWWSIPPECVLLVDDGDSIPALDYFTDCPYGDMTGDYLMEIPVGRLPASCLSECSTMVAKCIAYENPRYPEDTAWYLKGVTTIREDNPPDEYYQADSRYARQLWRDAGYVVTESLYSLHGHSGDDLEAAINDGRVFVTYRGQTTGHWIGFDTDPADWTNGPAMPVLVGATCVTLSLSPYEVMFGNECVLTGSPDSLGGAVAYFGTTGSLSHASHYRSAGYRGFFKALFEEDRHRLGDATLRARFRVDSLFHDQELYDEWNLLGDPELNVWTRSPRRPEVGFDSVVDVGPQPYRVTVNVDGQPVAGASVCASMDSVCYIWGTTDSVGAAELWVTPNHAGPMELAFSGANLLPRFDTCRVRTREACHVFHLRHFMNDSPPHGNGDRVVNPGETVIVPVWVRNYGTATAVSVSGILSSADSFVTVLDSVRMFGTIPGLDSAFTGPDGYRLAVSPACTNDHIIDFNLRCCDANDSVWDSPVTLRVGWLELQFLDMEIHDSPPGGNGNGRLDPEETARLVVTLHNAGRGRADSVTAILRACHPQLVVTDSIARFGAISSRGTVNNDLDRFEMIAYWMVPETEVPCTLFVTAVDYATEFSFILRVGERCPTDPIPDGPRTPAEYWAYDDIDSQYVQRPVFDWVEIAGVGVRLDLGDNETVVLDLPETFGPFVYYGEPVRRISVCSNGWIVFDSTSETRERNRRLPWSGIPFLAANWDDLHPEEDGAIWCYHDVAGHRFVVEWDSVYSSGDRFYKFQVALYDTTRAAADGNCEILCQYQTPHYDRSTIGIQDSSATVAIQVVHNRRYERGAAAIESGRAIKFTTDVPVLAVQKDRAGTRDGIPMLGLSLGSNPSLSLSTIHWQVPIACRAELSVFDVAGREVCVLATGEVSAGTRSTRWDGKDNVGRALPAGVYLVCLSTHDCSLVRKLVLAR